MCQTEMIAALAWVPKGVAKEQPDRNAISEEQIASMKEEIELRG